MEFPKFIQISDQTRDLKKKGRKKYAREIVLSRAILIGGAENGPEAQAEQESVSARLNSKSSACSVVTVFLLMKLWLYSPVMLPG